MAKPKRWRKGKDQDPILGEPSPSLSPTAREQWEEVRINEKALRRITRAWATAEHENEVFARAAEGLHTKLLNSPVEGDVIPYMQVIIRREAVKLLMKIAADQRVERPVGDSRVLDSRTSNSVEDIVMLRETEDSLHKVLSPQQYAVLMLTRDGLDCEEIAARLGKSPVAVRQSLMLARRKLKRPEIRARLGWSALPE